MFFELAFVFVLGLIIGSFLNVVIIRLNTSHSNAGRSGCMSCGHTLATRELIPLVSFFVLRGRCGVCGSRISHQYWIVELCTALLFVAVWMRDFSVVQTLFAFVIVSLLVVIFVYDVRHTIIPNKIVYPFIGVGALSHIPALGTFTLAELPLYGAVVVLSAMLVAFPLFALWAVSKGRWMGFGDVKLVFGFGLLLSVYGGYVALLMAFVLGAVIGLALLFVPKVIKRMSLSPAGSRFTMSSEIPFAPFLIIGFFLVFLFDVDAFALLTALV